MTAPTPGTPTDVAARGARGDDEPLHPLVVLAVVLLSAIFAIGVMFVVLVNSGGTAS